MRQVLIVVKYKLVYWLLTNYILQENVSLCVGAIYQKFYVLPPRLLPGGMLLEKLGGCVRPASNWGPMRHLGASGQVKKICDIQHIIYDLTKNSKPYLWPDPYIKILF